MLTSITSVRFNSILLILSLFLSISYSVNAQDSLPEKCIQLPERTGVCPNILYKRSPVDVPQFAVKEGEILCICMADFASLRIPATDDTSKVDQIVSLTRASVKLNIDEKTLLEIIRK